MNKVMKEIFIKILASGNLNHQLRGKKYSSWGMSMRINFNIKKREKNYKFIDKVDIFIIDGDSF